MGFFCVYLFKAKSFGLIFSVAHSCFLWSYVLYLLSAKSRCKYYSNYINFCTDKEELFVPTPSYFEIVYLNPDKPAVVPCRVTTPSAKVTLHREFPAEEIETDGTDIIYDVKKGFVYQHPTSDHKGIVYCKAESQGAPQISIKYHLLYVEGKVQVSICSCFFC